MQKIKDTETLLSRVVRLWNSTLGECGDVSLALVVARESDILNIESSAELLEQTATALRKRALELRHSADGGNPTLPGEITYSSDGPYCECSEPDIDTHAVAWCLHCGKWARPANTDKLGLFEWLLQEVRDCKGTFKLIFHVTLNIVLGFLLGLWLGYYCLLSNPVQLIDLPISLGWATFIISLMVTLVLLGLLFIGMGLGALSGLLIKTIIYFVKRHSTKRAAKSPRS